MKTDQVISFVARMSPVLCVEFHRRDQSTGESWTMYRRGYLGFPLRCMDGKKRGGVYSSLQQAEAAAEEWQAYLDAPLTRKEIRHWFNEKWIQREEQKELLTMLKLALLRTTEGSHHEFAAGIGSARHYVKQMNNHTLDAIPDKVFHQLKMIP